VALGAAVQAAIIAGEPLDAILVDVTPHSLGIEVAEFQFGRMVPDRYNVIIHRNTTIPTSRSEIYSALHPEQSAIEVKIYQGEHPIASRNTLLGDFMFDQLRPEAPGQPPRITVQFDFDINGILHVSAQDRGSGKEARLSVTASHARLSTAEIASARADLEVLEQEDWEDMGEWDEQTALVPPDGEPEPSAAQMNLETIHLLARARRALTQNPDHTALEQAIAGIEAAVRDDDQDALADFSDTLLDLLYELEDE
jgi:molecular chaperone DnaK